MAFDDSLGQLFGVEMKNQCFFSDGTVRVYCQLSLVPKLGIEPHPQSKQQESVAHPI